MSGARFHQLPASKRSFARTIDEVDVGGDPGLSCRCRVRAASRARYRAMLRDSFYFLIALLSLAVMIGWLSFLTLAAQV